MNRKQAASALGITDRQLGNWANEPDFPADGRKGRCWNVQVIANWRDAKQKKGSPQSDELAAIRLNRERAKLSKDITTAKKSQIDLHRTEGNLVPRPALEILASTLLTELSDLLDQFPDLLSRHVCDNCSAGLKEQCTKDLDRIRRSIRQRLEDAGREADDLAT